MVGGKSIVDKTTEQERALEQRRHEIAEQKVTPVTSCAKESQSQPKDSGHSQKKAFLRFPSSFSNLQNNIGRGVWRERKPLSNAFGGPTCKLVSYNCWKFNSSKLFQIQYLWFYAAYFPVKVQMCTTYIKVYILILITITIINIIF